MRGDGRGGASAAKVSASASSRKRSQQYGFRFDQRRCNGCKTCEIACKDYHGLEGTLAYRTIYEYTGGTWHQDESGAWEQDVFCYHLSLSCNHCSNPVCVRFCSTGAVSKDRNGFVAVDPNVCVGCQSCMIACPYHAPRFDDARGVVTKCDGCRDRIACGKQPICVEACPMRALSFGPYTDIADDPDVVSVMAPLPSPDLTQPNFAIDPCAVARGIGDDSGAIANIREA